VIIRERVTANIEGDFVVFMIGMRVNNPLLIHKWFPVFLAMPPMIRELSRHPEMGLLHAEAWFGRTTIMIQYWRSMDQLLAYAMNKDAEHLPAWHAFNKRVGTDGSVGIWHETYADSSVSYETIYANMPAFGLGKAGSLKPATGNRESAGARLRSIEPKI